MKPTKEQQKTIDQFNLEVDTYVETCDTINKVHYELMRYNYIINKLLLKLWDIENAGSENADSKASGEVVNDDAKDQSSSSEAEEVSGSKIIKMHIDENL